MEISEKASLFEKVYNMYNASDASINYWKDWAKQFINVCKDIGWTVEKGDGSSLGIVTYADYYSGSYSCTYTFPKYNSNIWDCDWRNANGIDSLWLSDNNITFKNSWFPGSSNWLNSGDYIDEATGRFDFIVYVDKNSSGEQIGFRVKYPVCTIGYESVPSGESASNLSYIYTVPVFSLYSSYKGNISLNTEYNKSGIYEMYTSNAGIRPTEYKPKKDLLYKGFIYPFGGDLSGFYTGNYGRYCPNFIICKNNPVAWNFELETQESFYTEDNTLYETFYIDTYNSASFIKTWKKFNKVNYQTSASGDTTYFYISSEEGKVGVKFILTTLENNEKALMMEHWNATDDNILFESCCFTEPYSSNIYENNYHKLIRVPLKTYTRMLSQTNQFVLSKMLIPYAKDLCTDLYYVTKKDRSDPINTGVYIVIKDKKGESYYFRVIPFGSARTYEVEGDNTTYLAFPVADYDQNNNTIVSGGD